jgi:hypothetical protein
MNLLQTLWSWLTSLFAKAPALVEEGCCPEDCCEDTECGPDDDCCPDDCCEEEDCCEEDDCCGPAPDQNMEIHAKEKPDTVVLEGVEESESAVPVPVGGMLRQILLAEGISEGVIEKYQIIEAFEGWYAGVVDEASIRASIQDFKSAKGGVIKAKLSRLR